jgi:DNA-binding LacI/PurR family transcriptional regulator
MRGGNRRLHSQAARNAGNRETVLSPKKNRIVRPTGKAEKVSPLYAQVAEAIRAWIVASEEAQPVRIPPERDLCTIHKVSRITIRRAMEMLAAEGLIDRRSSRGTLTVPEAIAQYKRRLRGRVIHVLTNWEALQVPTGFYGRIYQGIRQRSEKAGVRLEVQELVAPRTAVAPDLHLPDRVETLGVIFVGCMNEMVIRYYTDAGYPAVAVDYWTTNPQADAIVTDCYSEGQMAVDFLLRQGHSQFFFIGNMLFREGVLERESDAELLLAGMQRALVQAGLPPMPARRVRFLGARSWDGRQAAAWLASLDPRPTAGVVFRGGYCADLMRYLLDLGIRCPEDVSLVTKAPEGEPSDFACLRGPAERLGEMAVDVLLDRATGRRSGPMKIVLPSWLERGRTVRQLGNGRVSRV